MIVALVAILLVVGATRSGPQPQPNPVPQPQPQPQPLPQPVPPQPQPQPVPPQPQPVPPQPQPVPPQPQPQPGAEILQTVQIEGEGQNIRIVGPSSTFRVGQPIGAYWRTPLPGAQENAVLLWVRMEGDRPVLLAEKGYQFSKQGGPQNYLFIFRQNGPPGIYRVGLLEVLGNDQFRPIAIVQFKIE
jgi:hypothetical protein